MKLTKTEFTVSAYVSAGYDTKEIASKVFRSYHTISTQIKKIRSNNNLKNMAEISREFVLAFGYPRKYVAIAFLTIQLGSIAMSEESIKRFKRTSKRTTKLRRC